MSYKKHGTGDNGMSSLYDGTKVEKNSDIFEAIGNIDEVNSYIGIIIEECVQHEQKILEQIQKDLMDISSYIATPRDSKQVNKVNMTEFPDKYLELEEIIKEIDSTLPKLTVFLLPRGKKQYIRAIIRRAERSLIPLYKLGVCSENCYKYINRLSDLFFVLSRTDKEDVKRTK